MAQSSQTSGNQEFQQMLYVLQMLENQQGMLSEQLDMINTQIQGINISKATMEGFRAASTGDEIMIPLGTNAFTYAKIIDPNRVIVSISKEILIEKTLDEGIAEIERMLVKYHEIREKLNHQLQEVSEKHDQLRAELERVYRRGQ